MTPPAGPRKPRRQYTRSGIWSLKTAVRLLGGRAIDRRTQLGQALEAWREDLIADLGGRETLSTQQLALVDVALKTKLMLDSIDAWILQQPSLVNARKRALLPVVRERAAIAGSLLAVLKDLGLHRKAKRVPSLAEVLESRSAPSSPDPPAPSSDGTEAVSEEAVS